MSVVRLAIITLVFLPSIVLGQTKVDGTHKVSNDQPDRPLQMPPASSEVKEAFDDYERFRKRGAWERALKSLYTIPEDQALRFVDGQDGFIIPVARKRREVFAELPNEGQVAYRLFYDDEAKKLLDRADGGEELNTLERIFSAYFYTTVGDNAADRLGDLYFEMGRFDRAADCWLAVLRERPDTDLSPALISVKAVLALSRAGRQGEIIVLRRDLADRYKGEKVSIGGQSATVEEHLKRYLTNEELASRSSESAKPGSPELAPTETSTWRMMFSESIEAGMTPTERTQWESNPLSATIPAVAVEGTRLYANLLGYVFALNLQNGKLLWRSGSFHNVDVPAAQDQARMLDPARFAILASKSHVWSVGKDLKDPNPLARFRLTCRRVEGGDVVWQSTDLPDYSQIDLVGAPILANGGETLFVVGKSVMNQQQQRPPQQFVLAIHASDGKMLWKREVGTFRQGQRFYYYGMMDKSPLPRLLYESGSVFVDTHEGVLARIDAVSGDLDWGYGYSTDPVDQGSRFFFRSMMQQNDTTSSSEPVRSGNSLFVKGAKSDRIYAIDADRLKVLWDRPIAKSSRLLGADAGTLYLGGPEICAIDRQTRGLIWATRLPGGSMEGRVLVRLGGIWQLTSRGIFELDPKSGRVRRIFRGEDTGADGGDLHLAGSLLLAVSNRSISAYSLASSVVAGTVEARSGPAAIKTRASNE